MMPKRTCPNCGSTLRPRYVDCIYGRDMNRRLTPIENAAGKQVIFVCPRCVYAES